MLSHVSKHTKRLKEITKEHHEISGKLITITGGLIFRCLLNKIIWKSKRKRMDSFITKNKKLDRLITYSPSITPDYNIPIINLSTINLNQKELNQLKMGLDYSFVDKNKHVKKNIATSMKSVAEAVDKDLDNEQRENFHELLQTYSDSLKKKLYFSTDYTYNNLMIMIKNDYVKKMQEMIDNGIQERVYAKTEDNTLQDLKRF